MSKKRGTRSARSAGAGAGGGGGDDILEVPGPERTGRVLSSAAAAGAEAVAGAAGAASSAPVGSLMAAKRALSASLLRAGLRGRVLSMRAPLRVADAVAAAPRNVHAVGIGFKVVNGKVTTTPCVRIYVLRKLAKHLMRAKDLLPSSLGGFPTDIIESQPAFIAAEAAGTLKGVSAGRGRARGGGRRKSAKPTGGGASGGGARRAAGTSAPGTSAPGTSAPGTSASAGVAAVATAACTDIRRRRQDPKPAGISAAHLAVTAGTIAYFCRSARPGDNPAGLFALSNNHVFADSNKGRAGDDIYQPGPADGGTEADHFADLHRFVPIRLGGEEPNYVDAAIARLRPGTRVRRSICSIGRVNGSAEAVEQMKVCKHGRTTGYTEGIVTDVAYDALVGMDHLDDSVVALFEDQIRVEVTPPFPAFGLGGDSGSLVVDRPGHRAVGLFFAGPPSGDYGIANHIADVLQAMEITLV